MTDAGIVCTLTAPGGAVLDHGDTLRFRWEVDKGWTWSCTVHKVKSGTYDYRHARDGVYTITANDGLGASITLPPMVAKTRIYTDEESISGAGEIELSGTCLATLKMGAGNQSFSSFKATTSTALVTALATQSGLTVSGLPEWYIGEEEVKGETLASALTRLLEVSAYDAVVSLAGAISITAWEAVGDALVFNWATLKQPYDPFEVFTGKRLGKQSSIPTGDEDGNQEYRFDHADSFDQALVAELTGPGCFESDLLGAIAAVGFFDMDPNNISAGLVAFYSFDTDYTAPPISSSPGPATHMRVVCKDIGMPYPVEAVLKVTGTPAASLPEGADLSFTTPAPTGDPDTSLGVWPSHDDLIDPLFPGQTWAEARQPYILAKENSDGDKLLLDGVFQLGVRPHQRLTYATRVYKVWAIDWDSGGDKTDVVMVRV